MWISEAIFELFCWLIWWHTHLHTHFIHYVEDIPSLTEIHTCRNCLFVIYCKEQLYGRINGLRITIYRVWATSIRRLTTPFNTSTQQPVSKNISNYNFWRLITWAMLHQCVSSRTESFSSFIYLGTHTNNIEARWCVAKNFLRKKNGVPRHMLPSYLDEHLWRIRRNNVEYFRDIIVAITRKYPL